MDVSARARARVDAMPASSALLLQPDSRLDSPLDLDERSQRHRGSSASDGRDVRDGAVESLSQQLQSRSSPTAASVESFSSYINKDAPLFQQRSSSPRAEDQLRDHSDPASHTGSPRLHPRHLVSTPVVSRDAFRHRRHWADSDPSHPSAGVMSIEHLHNTSQTPHHLSQHAHLKPGAHQRIALAISAAHRAADRSALPASPTPAIDVNRLSVSNLAQKNQEDDERDPTYRDPRMRAPASLIDDSFESTASVVGEDAKNEIRRRRRTRPDEANLLAQVYATNAFPDHETRLFLANRVGMSVRAVSVWFQNRRQAEKKRSGRYGGSGIAPNAGAAPSTGQSTPAVESTPAKPSATVLAQRKPLGNASENAASAPKRSEPVEMSDMSSDNKENIPPWLVARATTSRHPPLEPLKRQTPAKPCKDTLDESAPASTPRDLRQAVGPQGMGIAHVEVDACTPKTTLSRHRSTPRLSLDDVLSGRSQTLRRAATERAPLAALTAEEGLDTILPPPKLLSRASSASSLSLLTTSGGRASIGNITATPTAASPAASQSESLTSSLPPQLTAVLQRQGIIAGVDPAQGQVERSGLLGMMPSSSVSSSEADASHDTRDEEDEERTLKLIAQRRAAKGQESRADAREAIANVGGGDAVKKVVGLAPARAVSLDWAAGRDRASTTALPVGTPLSRSVSMRLPTASTPLSTRAPGSAPETAAGDKRKRPSARSLSATDLTRRLQDAKRKTDRPATRKKPARVDENIAPTAQLETAKRRRVEELPPFGGIGMVSPMLSRSFAYPSRPVGLTATPQYVRAVSTPFARRWDLHTPSRVLGDRTNFTPAPTAQAFSHDDSGFFDCDSPQKRDDPNDHQAAELLLGLGKSAVDSRDSSASQ
ncbi:hypothetical protein PANT_9c00160 [Moesziomyces antarcticus T-34]|uniref:Homeobox domain-containing protein n=1 Tax=Pseudozyma antarctica (strain T-34) TaxID=1151754 RepID=M9M0R4_PSEA3|nr:hypothetical protein PANT_9c00160 [Moesziomyces antarcticus T-34]